MKMIKRIYAVFIGKFHNVKSAFIIKRKNIKKTVLSFVTMLLFGMCVIFISKEYEARAKYIMSNQSKEVINANSFYFTSNYLSPIGYDGSIAEYIMYGWDGKSKKSFAFNVRNYDNPLLYNNEEQDVKYEFHYEVLNGDEALVDVNVYKMVDGNEVEELNGELLGGEDSYSFNEYKLSIASKDEAVTIDHDVTVLLKVNTVESPYYAELTSKITLQYSQFKDFIAYQGVSAEEKNETMSALLYDIHTANQVDSSEMENTDISVATETIHLTWNNNLVEFNEFDKKVDAVFNVKTLAQAESEYEDITKCKNTVIIDEVNNVGHIYFDALAYSAYEIVFHKRISTTGHEDVWKNSEGEYLWNLTPAPLENGNVIYAETVSR